MDIIQKTLRLIRRYPLESGAFLVSLGVMLITGYAVTTANHASRYAYKNIPVTTSAEKEDAAADSSTTPESENLSAQHTPPSAVDLQAPLSNSTLRDPIKKEIAMKLISSAENSSLDWKAQYGYIEDIGDGRGYTAGIIGFCTSLNVCGDLLELVRYYTSLKPDNVLAKYISSLEKTFDDTHNGLDPNFTRDWQSAAVDPVFQQAQDRERDRLYFDPAVTLAISDGLPVLGQFAYYDAAVVHGYSGLMHIRARTLQKSKTPTQGAVVVAYMNTFLDERVVEMKKETAHHDVTRIETAQRRFLNEGNLHLNTPLRWSVYGDPFVIN